MQTRKKAVTVFGGSRVLPGSAEYDEARRLGSLLAKNGFVVCNGGYSGTMEAASRGAKEECGRTIGCTVDLLVGREANQWVDEEDRSASLLDRLERLISYADAFIVLRGGIGTLLELSLVWNLAQLDPSLRKPIVLVGHAWQEVVASFARELHVRPEDLGHIQIVDSIEEATALLLDQVLPLSMPQSN